jgi:hypothetical protein
MVIHNPDCSHRQNNYFRPNLWGKSWDQGSWMRTAGWGSAQVRKQMWCHIRFHRASEACEPLLFQPAVLVPGVVWTPSPPTRIRSRRLTEQRCHPPRCWGRGHPQAQATQATCCRRGQGHPQPRTPQRRPAQPPAATRIGRGRPLAPKPSIVAAARRKSQPPVQPLSACLNRRWSCKSPDGNRQCCRSPKFQNRRPHTMLSIRLG